MLFYRCVYLLSMSYVNSPPSPLVYFTRVNNSSINRKTICCIVTLAEIVCPGQLLMRYGVIEVGGGGVKTLSSNENIHQNKNAFSRKPTTHFEIEIETHYHLIPEPP